MATVSYESVAGESVASKRVKWEGLNSTDDVGAAIKMSDYQDRSVQIVGTSGTSTLVIEGSNDGGTTWATLNDLFGSALSFSAVGLEGIAELTDEIRPRLTAADGSTDYDVYLNLGGKN